MLLRRSLPSLATTRLASLLLLALPAFGCGRIEIPVTFGLVGDNTITMEVPFFPPGQNVFGTTLVGGADATVDIDLSLTNLLNLLLSPDGLAAAVTIDRINIAGGNIDLFGLHTGTICTYADPDVASGGLAFLRTVQNEADFHITMNTLIAVTDPFLLDLFPDPLPFPAQIDQEHVPVTLVDMLNLLAGKGADIEVHQVIEAQLPEDLAILGGSIITADVTLKTVEDFPVDPSLDFCEAFLAGP
jgi:hypothetical protein